MRTLVALGAALAALLLAPPAFAHPLGNFTVNHFTRIEVSGDRVYLRYVLDMAEIPTFQARGEVAAKGTEAYGRELAAQLLAGLSLTVDGSPVALRELGHEIAFPVGAAGLATTRLELVLDAGSVPGGGAPVDLGFTDTNDAGRIGWREVVLVATQGATVLSAAVPSESVSDELRAYPEDLLQSPLDVRETSARVRPGTLAGPPPGLSSGRELASPVHVAPGSEEGFAALVAREDLSVGVILVSLLVAMFWGAVHALSPGHGKAIVAAYLVGTRGTPRHALTLGLIVTVTHTVGVFVLGGVTLALSELVVPDDLYPWLNLVAAILVVGVGLAVLRMRILDWVRGGRHPGGDHGNGRSQGERHHRGGSRHGHDHGHEHGHDHRDEPDPTEGHAHSHGLSHGDHRHAHPHGHVHGGHHHHHVPEPGTGWRGLLGVGISGGLLPCPSALVVLLAAISLQRVAYGLVLIVAFSLGLAATITGIGLLAIGARRTFSRMSFEGPVVRALPAVSALVILAFGLAMTVRAVPALT